MIFEFFANWVKILNQIYINEKLSDLRETKDIGIAHQLLQEKFEDFLKSPDLDLDGKLIKNIINKRWGLAGKREKDKILAVKIPKSGYLKDYFKTSDPNEKRRLYCHCPRINTQNNGISENLENPEIFCYCGAGFYKGIWEEILQKPVQVEVLESVLLGGDVCKIAINLPKNP